VLPLLPKSVNKTPFQEREESFLPALFFCRLLHLAQDWLISLYASGQSFQSLKLNLRTQSVSDGHDLFASPNFLPVPVAYALGSQIASSPNTKEEKNSIFNKTTVDTIDTNG